MERLKACLVLGCNGSITPDGFTLCPGCENSIIDLEEVSNYNEIITFLDDACDLFDRAMTDKNKCSNTMNLLYKQFSAYNDSMLINVQSFMKNHRDCGLWIVLTLKEDL